MQIWNSPVVKGAVKRAVKWVLGLGLFSSSPLSDGTTSGTAGSGGGTPSGGSHGSGGAGGSGG